LTEILQLARLDLPVIVPEYIKLAIDLALLLASRVKRIKAEGLNGDARSFKLNKHPLGYLFASNHGNSVGVFIATVNI